MKATVCLQLTITLLLSCTYGQYPPSGYRPQGRPFLLPNRPSAAGQGVASNLQPQNQYISPQNNQYVPPQNQYKPPQNQYGPPQNQYGPPQNQYGAPSSSDQDFPVDVRYNGCQNQNGQNCLGQNAQPNTFNLNRGQQDVDQDEQAYPQQTYLEPAYTNNNFDQQDSSDQSGFGVAGVNNKQGWSGYNENQNAGQNPSLNRQYLSPTGNNNNNFQRQRQQNGNNAQTQALARRLNQNSSRKTNKAEKLKNDDDQNADQVSNGNDNSRSNFGIANQNYLPPSTTERKRYPEPTTRRPDEEAEEDEQENPNVSIATAIARGQYYLLQPDGRLQKVLYKTTQSQEELKNNAFSAKLVYQPVEPITAPIYTYAAPLVELS